MTANAVPGPTADALSAAIGLLVSYRAAIPSEDLLADVAPGDLICALVVLTDAALSAQLPTADVDELLRKIALAVALQRG